MKARITNILASLRQLKYPKELRIAPPVWPQDLLIPLEEIARLLQSAPSNLPETEATSKKDEQELASFLADVGTGLWRIRRKLIPPEMKDPPREMRGAWRALESTWDALTQGGLEIQDHTGEIITGGEALRIIAFQPSTEVPREQVIETIKPTIYYRDKLIQRGEVIVGKPDRGTGE